jgi:hypothetical protein
MALFGRKSNGKNRCPDCRFYVMVEGYGYCAKAITATINVRMLSVEGLRRQCSRCPEEMTCGDWQTK